MKLHEIPRKSIIECECSDGSAFVTFRRLDGMYSYCETERGNPAHLSRFAELELLENGHYKLKG